MMGGIGRAIGQVLLGVGDGLEKQATSNLTVQREREAAALAAQRQAALAALQHSDKMEEIGAQGEINDRNAARDDARGFAFGTQTAAQKQGYEEKNIRLKGAVDLANDKVVEGMRHTNKMSEDQYQAGLTMQHDIELAGTKVAYKVVSPKGEIGFYNERGQLISQTGQGVEAPKGDGGDGGEGYSYGAETTRRAGGGGTTTGTTTPPAAAKGKSEPLSIQGQLAKLPPPPGGKKGATATGPNGMTATWNGQRWVLNDYGG